MTSRKQGSVGDTRAQKPKAIENWNVLCPIWNGWFRSDLAKYKLAKWRPKLGQPRLM